jgi:aspartate aminotransferase
MIRLSKFASLVQPSATLAIGAKAKQMKASGVPVFDFSLGEPDQTTPAHIIDAAERSARAGGTHYTPVSGTPEVKASIVTHYHRFHQWDVEPERIVVTNGAKHAIHNAIVTTVGPGDEVIIPTPYWVSYSDLVLMAGAKPVLVPTTAECGFKMTPAQYRAARTPRTRLFMINSPCNPTGAVYTREELTALADAVCESDAAILSDEIYEQLCFNGSKPTCIASLRPDLAERTITVSGASKSYAMTGWRMGWAVAPPRVAQAMTDIQSQETSCPSSVSQAAAAAALTGPQECVAAMRAEYSIRRELVCQRLEAIPGVRLHRPDGAFYAFFDVSSYFGKPIAGKVVRDSASFCTAALEGPHVSLVPGSAFGAEGYVRMSFACARAEIEGGLEALAYWLAG